MRFEADFVCEKCGKRFRIDLGRQKLGELRTAKKIASFIGEVARACLDCCEGG